MPLTDDLDRAAALIERGALVEAAQSLSRIVQQHPANARALTLLGQVAAGTGDTVRAGELFAAAKRAGGTSATPGDPLAAAFPGVSFGRDVQCLGIGATRIGRGSCIGDGTWINAATRDGEVRMVIGECVLVGRRATLSSGSYLEIASFTIFGPNVFVSSSEHEYQGNHHTPMLRTGNRDHGRLVIEENCWLGVNAVVSGGITVGRGSVVGANCVLRQSIPPFSVVVGSPARIVRMYDPLADAWQAVGSEADQARIMEARAKRPVPERAELLAQLHAVNQGRAIPAILAGRGEHLA